MGLYQTEETPTSILIAGAWWGVALGILTIVLSVFLFRACAIGALPRLWSSLGGGLLGTRGSVLSTKIMLLPAGLLLIAGICMVYTNLVFKLFVNDEGILHRSFADKVKQGRWDSLWEYRIDSRSLALEFFRGDRIYLSRSTFPAQYPAIERMIGQRLAAIDMAAQQARLLREAGAQRIENPNY